MTAFFAIVMMCSAYQCPAVVLDFQNVTACHQFAREWKRRHSGDAVCWSRTQGIPIYDWPEK